MCSRDAPTDAELVSRYRDEAIDPAFSALVVRYQTRLYRVLLGMVRDPGLAEELSQRAFVKAALRIAQLADGQAFYSWLLSIARGCALDELRKRKVRDHDSFDPRLHEGQGTDLVRHEEEKEAVHKVLEQLSPDDRMALVLADLQGLSSKETAEALGVKESAAKMRVMRARERFRSLYEELTA